MSSLYGNVDDYTEQLRKLEQTLQGQPEGRLGLFRAGLSLPGDRPSGRRDRCPQSRRARATQGRHGQDGCSTPSSRRARRQRRLRVPPPAATAPPRRPPTVRKPTWSARGRPRRATSSIDLTIGEDSQFTWKATQPGKPAIELKGELTAIERHARAGKQGARLDGRPCHIRRPGQVAIRDGRRRSKRSWFNVCPSEAIKVRA